MTVNAVRWVTIDTIHAMTGLPLPHLNFGKLGRNVDAFKLLIEIHYQHYQFYSCELVAIAITYVCYRVKLGGVWPLGWPDVSTGFLEVVFFVTSRDTLGKYFARSQQLLTELSREQRAVVARGR